MEYLQCEYCGCRGVRVGFRGVTECCGCGAPSRSAPVTTSFPRTQSVSFGENITYSGMSYPEDDKMLVDKYGPNLTDESTDRVWG